MSDDGSYVINGPIVTPLSFRDRALALVVEALTSEDEIAHGEAWSETKGGLGVCAYCEGDWPCRTQRGIDKLLAALHVEAAERERRA